MAWQASHRADPSPGSLAAHIQFPLHFTSCQQRGQPQDPVQGPGHREAGRQHQGPQGRGHALHHKLLLGHLAQNPVQLKVYRSTGHFSLRQTSSRKGRSSGRRSKALLSWYSAPQSSNTLRVQGDSARDLDAVQRGDAEMEQKMNRALRACLERREGNPICSLHDQGAGGNGNVLKELSEPAGAIIYCSRFKKGDPTLSVLELWGAEYQESNALLLRPEDRPFLEDVCRREKCPVDFVGNITGDGKIVLVDQEGGVVDQEGGVADQEGGMASGGRHPVDLQLDWVLGKMPQKEFVMERVAPTLRPLVLPPGLTVPGALDRVLRLPCGAATAIGEQPIKGLVSPGAGARMAVAEALTNLVFAQITDLK
ncbi:hypothetical protein CRUP_014759, partial [Coryphaenoides rupestris]